MFSFEDALTALSDVALTLIALLIAIVVVEGVLYVVLCGGAGHDWRCR